MNRRSFLLAPIMLASTRTTAQVRFPAVRAGTPLHFPRDHGSHPAFRSEWWYVTAWTRDDNGNDLGVQITFFRNRPGVAETGTSKFAPQQLLFAHAAVADPRRGRLLHDQRAARAGFGLAEAVETTTDLHIGDWSLRLAGDTYQARIVAREFTLQVAFTAVSPPLLQGIEGVSRKGPAADQASFYYSRPQLRVDGTLVLPDRATNVSGTAWLDHEWSSSYLAPDARGWDWIGINFDDGSALMAFRIRGEQGGVFWAGGAIRDGRGSVRNLQPDEISLAPLRHWRSPRSNIDYPVAFRVRAGTIDITLEPLLDDQELDSRASVGTIYWEGAVRALDRGHEIGRGYLELTGYGGTLKL